jgi:Uma2 family endonuclease
VSELARERMTSDEFIAWAMEQCGRYELVAGEIVGMAPERIAHTRAKQHIWRRLAEAIEAGNLPCEALVDGMAVAVDETTTYEPDTLVRCGTPLPSGTVKLHDPIMVVEVVPPSSLARDAAARLEDYFRLPSVRHYLILKNENRTIAHHQCGEDGTILTSIVHEGPILLDPPGINLSDCFPPGVD